MNKRYFSEKEAADLVVRAAKLQEKAGGEAYTPGISFDELEKMAAEAGIDPAFLNQAMAGVPSGEEEAKTFLGIPLSTEFERVVDFELPPENFDVITEVLPPRIAGHGPRGQRQLNVGTQVGRTVQMQVSSGTAYGTLKMTSRNGRTRISSKQTMFLPFMAGLYPGMMIAFVSLMMLVDGETSSRASAAVNVSIAILALLLGGLVFTWLSKAGQAKMRAVTDQIAERVAEEGEILRKNLGSASVGAVEESEVENMADRLGE